MCLLEHASTPGFGPSGLPLEPGSAVEPRPLEPRPLDPPLDPPCIYPKTLTEDVEDDETLERRGQRSPLQLPLLLVHVPGVGGGQYEQEEEDSERRRVVHELHERGPQQLAEPRVGQHQVVDGHEGHEEDEADDDEDLGEEVALAPPGEPVVPDGGEELLAVRVRDELRGEKEERRNQI